jgi:hypothetical protein
MSFKVRAVTVGEDFFALLTGAYTCVVHGRIDGENVRGVELCQGASELPFSLRFGRP